MLNWTTGPAALAHAVGKLRATHVITSRKLIDRLGIEVPGAEYVFLEDLRGGIGKPRPRRRSLATYVAPRPFPPSRAAGRRRRPGRCPLHLRIGERAQGGALEPSEPAHATRATGCRPWPRPAAMPCWPACPPSTASA